MYMKIEVLREYRIWLEILTEDKAKQVFCYLSSKYLIGIEWLLRLCDFKDCAANHSGKFYLCDQKKKKLFKERGN